MENITLIIYSAFVLMVHYSHTYEKIGLSHRKKLLGIVSIRYIVAIAK